LSSIEEIIVVGHTDCGGVKACHDAANGNPPPIDWVVWSWLSPLRRLADLFKHQPVRELIDANVRAQVANVRSVMNTLPPRKPTVTLRGAVYNLSTAELEYIE